MIVFRAVALTALAVGVATATAGAQNQCQIDDNKPNAVKDARNALMKGTLIAKPDEKVKQLKNAVRVLDSNAEANSNPVGRNYVLGRALIALAVLPDMGPTVTRESAGFTTNPQGTIDLIAAADSALDAVEAAAPGCAAELEEVRRVAYAPLVNAAVNLYNDKQLDSAYALSQRTLVIYPNSPIAYNVIGNVLHTKNDLAGATTAFKKMIEAMGTDTAFADERKSTMLNIATLLSAQAEQAEGEKKSALMKEATAQFEAYLKEYPGDAKAQSGLARVQLMSGDSASASKVYSTMLSNPGQYTYLQLFEAGVGAARAERAAEAAQLFEAGLQKNPWYRDGLFNLAATYFASDKYDKMLPVMTRLLEVDPNNPDNYRLMAGYYQGRAKAMKTAAAKKPASDPAVKAYNAQNDSLLKYFKLFQEHPVRVTFNQFSHDGGTHTLGGTVENLSTAAKSYTLKVDFLDVEGKTVATKETTVEAVAPKTSKPFTVTADQPGIVAFKYAPLTN